MTIMRKVLLATTALIAVGTVQAASADVTISGSFEWQYNTFEKSGVNYSSGTTSDNSITNEIDVNIGFSSTTDSGLSLAMGYSLVENVGTTGNAESVGATISGDFGTLGTGGGFGEFGDKFATSVDVTADPASPFSASATGDIYDTPGDEMVAATGDGINYLSPDMNGFQFSLGMSNAGTTSHADTTAGGFQYAMAAGDASITLKYAMSATSSISSANDSAIDATSLGLVIGLGDATLTVAQNTAESTNGAGSHSGAGNAGTEAYDYKSTGVGLKYTVSDTLSVAAYTASAENDKDSAYDVSENGVSLTYTIADGLSASVTHTDMDVQDNNDSTSTSGNYTVVAVNLSF
jgi:hypothetical protein